MQHGLVPNRWRWPAPAWLLFVACLVYCLAAGSTGWDHPLLDDHGFRQTQTAISTYYQVGKAPILLYETPVLGPPWAIPFEFPLFQWIVAGLVTALGTPLDTTGRLVSLAFFLLTLFPAYVALGTLKISRDHRLVILSLFLVSPFYVFWSRTFLIESTALFLSTCYLACALRCLEKPARWTALAAVCFGILAGLVKITTFAVFFSAVVLALGCQCLAVYRATRSWGDLVRPAWRFVPILILPVVAALWWSRLADQVKEANPLGRQLTSTAVSEWILGSLTQRLAPETWVVIFQRWGLMLGHLSVLAICLLGLCYARRRWREVAACLLLALSAPLVFTNLHYVHEYYAYANGIFVIAAVGLCLVALLEKGPPFRVPALGVLGVILAVGVLCHRVYYFPKQAADHRQIYLIANAVQQATRPDDVILVVGFEWSPVVPYYSQRRALMLPNWKSVDWGNLRKHLDGLSGYRIGAVVIGPNLEGRSAQDILRLIASATNTTAVSRYTDGTIGVYALPLREAAVGQRVGDKERGLPNSAN